jgi:hypothetical protein
MVMETKADNISFIERVPEVSRTTEYFNKIQNK